MNQQRIEALFKQTAELTLQSARELSYPISQAVELMFYALSNGNKILVCGNGASAADSQTFAAALIGRFERERLPLPAIALSADSALLTSVSNAYSFQEVFSKQVQAFGQAGDVLLVMTPSGSATNVIAAVDAALERDMRIVALTGNGGGALAQRLSDADVHICVPHERSALIREIHVTTIHCLCDGIDVALFGEDQHD